MTNGTFGDVYVLELEQRKKAPMQSANESVETEAKVYPELSALDRCDICGAQAYIRAVLSTGELIFCSHHGNEQKEKLSAIAIHWQDETEKLLSR